MEEHQVNARSSGPGQHTPAPPSRKRLSLLFYALLAVTIIAMLTGIYFLINIYTGRSAAGNGGLLPYILVEVIGGLSLLLSERMDKKGYRKQAISILNSGLLLGAAAFLLSKYFLD